MSAIDLRSAHVMSAVFRVRSALVPEGGHPIGRASHSLLSGCAGLGASSWTLRPISITQLSLLGLESGYSLVLPVLTLCPTAVSFLSPTKLSSASEFPAMTFSVSIKYTTINNVV